MTNNRIGRAAIIGAAAALSVCSLLSGEPPAPKHTNDKAAYDADAYAVTISAGAKPIYAKGDFNGDGVGDFLTLDTVAHSVYVWLGWLGHGFVRQATPISLDDPRCSLAVANFKNDPGLNAYDDVAIGCSNIGAIRLFSGHPYTVNSATSNAFVFTELSPIQVPGPRTIALGKFDHEYDSHSAQFDLIIVRDATPAMIELWTGDGTGLFVASVKLSPVPEPIDDVWPGEHTGDKYIDVIATNNALNRAYLMKNDGTGGFSALP